MNSAHAPWARGWWWSLVLPLLVVPEVWAGSDIPIPRLAVVVVVDGLSPAVVEQVDDLFIGGFRRMGSEGAVLTDCHHDHAVTRTGPGFFVVLSGRHPGPAGVIENRWYDPASGQTVYCVEDPAGTIAGENRPAGSYRNVFASALGDWLKQQRPEAHVVSVAGKDRSAIFLGGRAADGVYWYDRETGDFVTSTYYRSDPHDWVIDFNEQRLPDSYRGVTWTRVVSDSVLYARRGRADDFPGEADISSLGLPREQIDAERDRPQFDHVMADEVWDGPGAYRVFMSYPFLDEVTMELAREAVMAEELGKDDTPDLLCIGLSTLDGVVHATGPYSQESIDVVLRLDRLIGEFLEFLDGEVGDGEYLVLLTSDHGFQPLPEHSSTLGMPGDRASGRSRRFASRVESRGTEICGGENPFKRCVAWEIYLDRAVLTRHGVSETEVIAMVREEAAKEDWVAEVFVRSELLADAHPTSDLARRYRNNVHPSRSGDILICPRPGMLLRSRSYGTDHGSPYDYDSWVPAVFMGPGVIPGEHDEFVPTVDLAPTLARLLRLADLPEMDGQMRGEIVESEIWRD